MRAVCLQHVHFEGPGVLARSLEKRGVSLEPHLVPEHGLPRDPGDVLIVMGGPMSVNDPDPWVKEETLFIKAALESGMPVLGVCLGAQFMAKALGATVRPGRDLEVGMTQIQLTDEGKQDPVFSTMQPLFEVLEWHGEVFDLPRGAASLASSALAPVQAFRHGAHAYGLVFHLEMERSGIDALCRECPEDVTRANQTPASLMAHTEPHLPRLHQWADRLIQHLVDRAG